MPANESKKLEDLFSEASGWKRADWWPAFQLRENLCGGGILVRLSKDDALSEEISRDTAEIFEKTRALVERVNASLR